MLLSPVNQVSPSTSRLPPVTVSRPDREVMLLPLPQNSLAYELSTTYACVCPALVPPDAGQLGVQMVFNSAQLESQIELAQLNNLPDAGQVLNLCDQRLVGLKVFGIWTNLEIEDGLAAQLISRYLETDHLIFGLFDADLFLQDISTGGQNFCSAPLVAAILAWACLSYANLYPEMPLLSLVKPFYSEADRLFWGVNEFSNITLVSTAALLELIASYSGKVDEAVKYQTAGLAISKSIGLFAERGLVSVDQEEQSWEAFSRQTMCARSHTAWGFFALRSNFDLIHCSNTVQRQPLLPLPGRDPYMDPEGLLSPLPRPLFVDSAFVAGCELAVLITEITYRMYRSPDGGTYQQHMMSLEQAEMLYRRLLAWAAALPPECARGDQNTPAILVMHMRFHVAVIALFQPFIAGPLGRLRLQTFASEGSAMSVFNLSIDQLKRLVIIYRRTFEYQVNDTMTGSTGSVFLASLLCQLGPSQERNDVLERSHYFAVCISSLLNLLPRILSMQAVVTGLVAVGLSTRTITSAYAKQVMAEVLKRGGDYDLVRDNIGSIAVVNFELALSDRLSATASHTAENLRDIDSTEGSELRTDVGADIT